LLIGSNALFLAAILVLQVTSMQSQKVHVDTTPVNVTEETIQPELNCPKPIIRPNVTVEDRYRHIQNPDMNTDYELKNNGIFLVGIDQYGHYYGGSMAPSLMQDDRLLVEKYTDQELDTGMIVRVRISGQNVIHRIVSDHGPDGYIILSGDNSDARQRVKISQVTHVVKGVVYG